MNRFRGGKAEHNLKSLAETLQVQPEEGAGIFEPLKEIGFLEPVGQNYKVPMLYRSGLSITQGRAFQADEAEQLEEDEE